MQYVSILRGLKKAWDWATQPAPVYYHGSGVNSIYDNSGDILDELTAIIALERFHAFLLTDEYVNLNYARTQQQLRDRVRTVKSRA